MVSDKRIAVDPNPCWMGWGPGCDPYSGGHFCDREAGHSGRHRCVCGSWRPAEVHPEDMPTDTGPDRIRRAVAIDRGGYAPREPFMVCDRGGV